MKTVKSLNKRIRRLKERLEKDAKKLAKLTMKLGVAMQGEGGREKKKSGLRRGSAKKRAKAPKAAPTQARQTSPARKTAVASAKPSPARRARKKLNLTPERRAQLAAAMKARWEAKRAAGAGTQMTPPPESSQA